MTTVQLDGLRPVAHAKLGTKTWTNNNDTVPCKPNDLSECCYIMTIHCLRALFKTPVAKCNHTENELSVTEFADQLLLPDLREFFRNSTFPEIPLDVEPKFISIDCRLRTNRSVAEVGLVTESASYIQIIYSIILPQQVRLYQVGDSVNMDSVGTCDIFLDSLMILLRSALRWDNS
jgi:tripeptidyl-peptidase-1